MFDFSKVSSEGRLSKEDILRQVDEQSLYEYFFGQPIVPKKRYRNPLRVDKHEGCFFSWKHGLRFHDYAKGISWDVFAFIQEKYRCDFPEALRLIQESFSHLKRMERNVQRPAIRESKDSQPPKIQFESRPFTQSDLRWWGDYLITEEELKSEHIYSVSKLWIDNSKTYIPELCFAYYYPEIDRVKIYKPLEKKQFKWYSNVPYTYIDTISQLPHRSDTLLVAKSKKDKIVLKKILSDVCATQGENYYAIPVELDETFDQHYKRKVCWFDCDATGKEANKALNSRGYGWVNIEDYLYLCCGIKDPSDYVKEFKEYEYLINLLKQKNISRS